MPNEQCVARQLSCGGRPACSSLRFGIICPCLLLITFACATWAADTPPKKTTTPMDVLTVHNARTSHIATSMPSHFPTYIGEAIAIPTDNKWVIPPKPNQQRGGKQTATAGVPPHKQPRKMDQNEMVRAATADLVKLLYASPKFSPWQLRFEFLSLGVPTRDFMVVSSANQPKIYVSLMLEALKKIETGDLPGDKTVEYRALEKLMDSIESACINDVTLTNPLLNGLNAIRVQAGIPSIPFQVQPPDFYDHLMAAAESLSTLLGAEELHGLLFQTPTFKLAYIIQRRLGVMGKRTPDMSVGSQFYRNAADYDDRHPTLTLTELASVAFHPVSGHEENLLSITKGDIILFLFGLPEGGINDTEYLNAGYIPERKIAAAFRDLLRKKWRDGDSALRDDLALLATRLMNDNFLTLTAPLPAPDMAGKAKLINKVMHEQRVRLCEAISAPDHLPSLFAKRLILEYERQTIMTKGTTYAKNTELLSALERRMVSDAGAVKTFNLFVAELRRAGATSDVADLLEKALAEKEQQSGKPD